MFENAIHIILFYALSAIIIFSSLGLVFFQNLLHACISMFCVFFFGGMLFILLNSDFLGIVQISIYSIALCIMFAIIIMLSGQKSEKFEIKSFISKTSIAFSSITILFMILIFSITNGFSLFDKFSKPFGIIDISKSDFILEANFSIKMLAINLLSKYIFAFEVISLIILIALIGIVVLNNINKGEIKDE